MFGKLTTHVLDTTNGCPAGGMKIELWSLAGDQPELITTVITNTYGRTDSPLLKADKMKAGQYELVFFVGDYFTAKKTVLEQVSFGGDSITGFMSPLPQPLFLDKVPVRFGIADAGASYHIPLLVSPWAYSTYRGS